MNGPDEPPLEGVSACSFRGRGRSAGHAAALRQISVQAAADGGQRLPAEELGVNASNDRLLALHRPQSPVNWLQSERPGPAMEPARLGESTHSCLDCKRFAARVLRISLAHRECEKGVSGVVLRGPDLHTGLERPEVELDEVACRPAIATCEAVRVLDDKHTRRQALSVVASRRPHVGAMNVASGQSRRARSAGVAE
jgi:hypothetical protein